MSENERTEEEEWAEAHELVENFLKMIAVEAVIDDDTVNFNITVPVVEPLMDLSKLGLPEGAPPPPAIGVKMDTGMPLGMWQSWSQATIREDVKRQVVSHLCEQGVIRDA